MQPNSPLLQVQDLEVIFESRKSATHAVRGVSFQVHAGESIGIVGESGCGKTTIIQAITGLVPKAKVTGTVLFDGIDVLKNHRHLLGKKIGMVFQDPMTSLNPTMKIGDQIEEAMIFHKIADKSQAHLKALELLRLVDISDVRLRMNQYPHQLSGGQRQRVSLAIALSCNPKLLIADEPTTALDVTTQAQILHLIMSIQNKWDMSFILVTHDLGIIQQICDRIFVCYAGKIIETGSVEQVLYSPKHPYTRMLLDSKPNFDYPKSSPLKTIEGICPSLDKPIHGCAFAPRCPYADRNCIKEPPLLSSLGDHLTACWRNAPL